MIISQNGAVDLIPEYNRALRPIFCVSEGDANSRTINLTVTSAGEVFTIPEGAEVYVAGKKQDNTIFTYQCAYSGYIVSFPVAEQMSAANGLVLCELQIVVAGDPLGSANFCYWVEPSPIANGSSSESDLNIFEQAIAALGGYEYLTSEVSVLSARMDQFARLPDGSISTTADAELVDIRVQADGKTASTAGDAVRTQVAALNTKTTALSHIPTLSWTYNKIISAAGVISNSQYYALSNIIECQEGDVFINGTPVRDEQSGFSVYHVLYKTTNLLNDTFFQRVGASSNKVMTIPAGVTGYQMLFGRSTTGGVPIAQGDTDNAVLYITRKGPGYDDLNQSLRILCIGNSFSQDAVAYMPYLLEGTIDRVKITLGIAYYPAATIDNYNDFFDNDTAVTFNKREPNAVAWAAPTELTLKNILTAEHWDVITFQQGSRQQEDYSTYSNLNALIDKVVDYTAANNGKAVRVGWLMPQLRKSIETESSYANLISATQNVLRDTPCDFVIPIGTAIQTARGTSLDSIGDSQHLTYDGAHLQEGLPCLLAAYVSTIWALRMIGHDDKTILGNLFRPTQAWMEAAEIPGHNGTVVGVTDANCRLAQKCAIAAIKAPYEVSIIS